MSKNLIDGDSFAMAPGAELSDFNYGIASGATRMVQFVSPGERLVVNGFISNNKKTVVFSVPSVRTLNGVAPASTPSVTSCKATIRTVVGDYVGGYKETGGHEFVTSADAVIAEAGVSGNYYGKSNDSFLTIRIRGDSPFSTSAANNTPVSVDIFGLTVVLTA